MIYTKCMKLLAAILVFLLAAPPVQAGFCDMEAANGEPPHHAGMQHGDASERDATPAGHDCCKGGGDRALDGADSNCSTMLHCGACVAGFVALNAVVISATAPLRSACFVAGSEPLTPSHAALPYRPPIRFS